MNTWEHPENIWEYPENLESSSAWKYGQIAFKSPNTNVPILLLFQVQWVEVHLILFCLHHTSLPPPSAAALLEKTRFSTFQNDYEPSSQLAITEMGYLDLVLCIICKMFCLFRIIRREFTISQIFLWTKQFAVFWLDWCPIKGQSIEHNKGNYCSFGTKILFLSFL